LSFEAREAIHQGCAIPNQPGSISQKARQKTLGMKRQVDDIYAIQLTGRNGGRGVGRSRFAEKDRVDGKSHRQIFEHGSGADGTSSDGGIGRLGRQE
jgi:hypothetical protein